MHEMSIAANILKISEEESAKAENKKIEKICLQVGRLSGVVTESLRFALEVSKNESVLQNAEIVIDEIPGKLHCLLCDSYFESNDFFTCCPNCGLHKFDIVSGKELTIKSITLVQQDG
jgi:hydrogenase nickel incorporation protein HypA/HybF